jgi:hypothetical protein
LTKEKMMMNEKIGARRKEQQKRMAARRRGRGKREKDGGRPLALRVATTPETAMRRFQGCPLTRQREWAKASHSVSLRRPWLPLEIRSFRAEDLGVGGCFQ